MTTSKVYTFNQDELVGILNQARENVVNFMYDEKMISDFNKKKMLDEYAFIIYRPGMLGKIIDKLLFKDDANDNSAQMRIIHLGETDEKDEEESI